MRYEPIEKENRFFIKDNRGHGLLTSTGFQPIKCLESDRLSLTSYKTKAEARAMCDNKNKDFLDTLDKVDKSLPDNLHGTGYRITIENIQKKFLFSKEWILQKAKDEEGYNVP